MVDNDLADEVKSFIDQAFVRREVRLRSEASAALRNRGKGAQDAKSETERVSVHPVEGGTYSMLEFDAGGPLDNAVLWVLDAITPARKWFGRVWPEYVASLFEHTNYYPAAPPRPTSDVIDYPTHGGKVKVWVVDLGFGGVWGDSDDRPAGLPTDAAGTSGVAGRYSPATVHGDLVALVAAQLADGKAQLKGKSLLSSSDSDAAIRGITASGFMPLFSVRRIVEALEAVSEEEGDASPGIVVLACGAYVHPLAPPKDLIDAVEALVKKGWHVVAAAGNDGSASAPVYPAIDPSVLGVEARETGQFGFDDVACYSNQHPSHVGGPGEHTVPFPRTILELREPIGPPCSPLSMDKVRWFGGAATIRGTSFAAPAVAGLLAKHGGPAAGKTAHVLFEDILPEDGFSL